MPLAIEVQKEINDYCTNHVADKTWYQKEFDFITDTQLCNRLIVEFTAIRFAYKLYEGIAASDENLLFEVRSQILSYAAIYEAIIHYILYTYYSDTPEFEQLTNHVIPIRIDIPGQKMAVLKKELSHDGKDIFAFYYDSRRKEDTSIRFDQKCLTAEKLGLIHKFTNDDGEEIDLTAEIIEIYNYRNGIHLVAEQRKGIQYELELSKKAYWRMRPFIDQVKERLLADAKCCL